MATLGGRNGWKLLCFCFCWCGPSLDDSDCLEAEMDRELLTSRSRFTVRSGRGCVWVSWGPLLSFLACRFSPPWIRREKQVQTSYFLWQHTQQELYSFLQCLVNTECFLLWVKRAGFFKAAWRGEWMKRQSGVSLWRVLGRRAWRLWQCNLSSLITAVWHWHFSRAFLLLTHTHTCSNYNNQAITSFCQSVPALWLTGHFGRKCCASLNTHASSSSIKLNEHECLTGGACFITVICFFFKCSVSWPTDHS